MKPKKILRRPENFEYGPILEATSTTPSTSMVSLVFRRIFEIALRTIKAVPMRVADVAGFGGGGAFARFSKYDSTHAYRMHEMNIIHPIPDVSAPFSQGTHTPPICT
jgi:hypothetical protein